MLCLPPLLFGCNPSKAKAEAKPEPNRRDITRQAMRASVWRFVYCLQDPAEEDDLKTLLEEIARKQPAGKRIEVLACSDLSADSLGSGPFTLFGDRLPEGSDALPLKQIDSSWEFDGRIKFGKDDVLFLPYLLNPWAKQPTVSGIYLSENSQALIRRIREEYAENWDRLFWRNRAYELYRANGDRIYGSFLDTSWAFNPAEEIKMEAPDRPIFDESGLKIYAYDGPVNNDLKERGVRALRRISRLVDTATGTQSDWYPEVRFYPTLERIGLRTGKMDPIQYASETEVLHVVPSFVNEEELMSSFATWRPFVEKLIGGELKESNLLPAIAKLQTYASTFGEEVLAKAQTETALRLWQAGMPHGTEDLEKSGGSTLIAEAAARALAMRSGAEKPTEMRDYLLRTGKQELAPVTIGTHKAHDYFPEEITRRAMPEIPLAGMTFAHEGYRIHNGYGGEKIKPSMDSLAALHVNAISIVPYSFLRDPNKVADLPISNTAGNENDWAVSRSIREAHERGWFVMLKPQIWVGRGSWPGDIDFETEEEWETFFSHYTYWIMHYALLAEREKVGALCLGTEMRYATLKYPDHWREIIRKVRMVYGGQLTYAANWGEEFEGFSFWEELDAIGLNSYYPLSELDAPTDEELFAGAQRWMQMAQAVSQRVGKPLWLTETGFRSVEQAWKNPHADAGERPSDPETQARCYEALLRAAAETPELRGIFIWKWPSYLGDEGSRRNPNKGFTPGGKPAAKELADFYESWR